ncbi:MAG: M55 family metallopeptidase [Synergistaceae bacterium]|jgi:D-amino peptidase|nr:M55 family metallopeptidase [Synergistaceae bacterium]
MKVYISIDAEGSTGIFKNSQVCAGRPEYEFCRRMMEGDANAAVRGAFRAGAAEVLVNDSHDGADNIRIENLDPRARLISGSVKPLSMMEGIDSDFNAVLLLGYHSRKSERGTIAHTYSYSRIFEARINGKPVGEAEINGFVAGSFGVPVVFLSGDQYVTENIRAVIPGIKTVAVKKSLGLAAAECAHPSIVWEQIEAAVYDALSGLKTSPVKPLTDAPYTLEVQFASTAHATLALRLPGSCLQGATTVCYKAEDYMTIYNAFLCMNALTAAFDDDKD